jgi:hypothetical protein
MYEYVYKNENENDKNRIKWVVVKGMSEVRGLV